MSNTFENYLLRLTPNGVAEGARVADIGAHISSRSGRAILTFTDGTEFMVMGNNVLSQATYEDGPDPGDDQGEPTTQTDSPSDSGDEGGGSVSSEEVEPNGDSSKSPGDAGEVDESPTTIEDEHTSGDPAPE